MSIIALGDIELSVGPWDERWASTGVSFPKNTVWCQISITSFKIAPMILIRRDRGELLHSPSDFYPQFYAQRSFSVPLPGGLRLATTSGPERYLVNAEIAWAICFPSQLTRQDLDFGPDVSSVVLTNCGSVGFQLHVKSDTSDYLYARASYLVSS